MVEGIPDSAHEQVSYCFVFPEPGWSLRAPSGIRSDFSVVPLHPALLLVVVPTSARLVGLSSCSTCPPLWFGSLPKFLLHSQPSGNSTYTRVPRKRPISRSSQDSSRSSRSRRHRGRRHPRPRSRPTPSGHPPKPGENSYKKAQQNRDYP